MIVYLLTSAISVWFAFLVNKSQLALNTLTPFDITKERKLDVKTKFFVFLSFLPLYIVSAIRYCVGTDYAGTYRLLYNSTYIFGYKFNFKAENLYALLNRIAIMYSGADYTGVFALSSMLICGFTFLGFVKVSKNIGYSVLFWIVSGAYFWTFNGVRQAIAMSVFIFAFQYIKKQKPIHYIVCIIIAIGFHKIALLYLPMYYIHKIKLNLAAIAVILIAVFGFAAFFKNTAIWLSANITMFNVFNSRYFETDIIERSSFAHIFINILFLILFIIITRVYKVQDEESNGWVNMQFVAVVFSLLISVIPWVSRLSRLYAAVLPLSIPYIVALIPNEKSKRFINASIVSCYCIYTFITYFILKYHNVLPYRTIFNK